MDSEKPRVTVPSMCPECRAGKRYIKSTNKTKEHELSLRLQFECDRCGWTTDRRQL